MRVPKFLEDLSLLVNRLTGGPKGYSLCARFYEGRLEGKKFHTFMVKFSDRLFWFDKNHCYKAWRLRCRNVHGNIKTVVWDVGRHRIGDKWKATHYIAYEERDGEPLTDTVRMEKINE